MPIPHVLLVTTPAVKTQDFLGTCKEALGYSLSRAADSSERDLSEAETFLSYLAAFRDEKPRVGSAPNPKLLTHVSFSMLVIADERDMRDILECCSGMSFVTADTLASGVLLAVITGTLAQWRDAVAAGSVRETKPSVRAGFNRICNIFRADYLNVWTDYKTPEALDGTFLLEEKPRR